ncbi:hypothetical protein [Vulcanisaeta distributa]|uniref:Uncharacterized protein n=1 Tax=Vulcanisaeta distributa (strain DSM 14429 / JCM 11212 / NBRC 100878 / IC-017) TaxID=572478 RepID=E1QPB5_VULDI|nr:hypothetical protein [Vulcanisaeta distributa]ADN50286.1 hypothetical protein Vdis_0896 [Vulcanisaeta distributa DSM 14429]
MAFEIIDLIISIIILIIGFSVFTALVNDYRIVVTTSRILRKKIKVSAFRELMLPIYPSLIHIRIVNVKPLMDNVDVEIHGNMIKVINKGNVINNSEIKILIEAVIVGRLGDYPVRGTITLSPY